MTSPLTILQGSALELLKTLPDESVHCCVTSPPYWGLRDYSACSCKVHVQSGKLGSIPGNSGSIAYKDPEPACPKCHGSGKIAGVAEHQLGLEKTPEEYIAKLVAIFREVRRVLRSDGTCWVNLGDSYAGSWGNYGGGDRGAGKQRLIKNGSQAQNPVWEGLEDYRPVNSLKHPTIKPKDMVGIPWAVAFALRADGWYLRSEIIWAKKNTMPESVTDRPTKSHEQIFLLAKSSSYFYDHTAILEPCSTSTHARISQDLQNQIGTFRANGGGKTNGPLKPVFTKVNGPNSRMMRERTPEGDGGKPNPSRSAVRPKVAETGSGIKSNESWENATCMPVAARNKRDVWFIGTQPYSEAHFATFPPDLIKPCILAGTSARGCCPTCGAPWERIVEDGAPLEEWKKASGADKNGEYHGKNTKDYERHKAQPASTVKERILKGMVEKNTVRWEPTCTCPLENPVPCTVLDPFFGSGTTGQVALEFGRHAIGLELNPEYIELCKTRCHTTQGLALA